MEKNCCTRYKNNKRSEEEKHNLITRINRINGQLNGVKKMIEEDRYCDDILIQLSAIDKAIRSLTTIVLSSHMHTCLIEELKQGNEEIIDEILELFKRFQ